MWDMRYISPDRERDRYIYIYTIYMFMSLIQSLINYKLAYVTIIDGNTTNIIF